MSNCVRRGCSYPSVNDTDLCLTHARQYLLQLYEKQSRLQDQLKALDTDIANLESALEI